MQKQQTQVHDAPHSFAQLAVRKRFRLRAMIVVRCDLVSCLDPLRVNAKQVLRHLLRVSTLCLPDIIACDH